MQPALQSQVQMYSHVRQSHPESNSIDPQGSESAQLTSADQQISEKEALLVEHHPWLLAGPHIVMRAN